MPIVSDRKSGAKNRETSRVMVCLLPAALGSGSFRLRLHIRRQASHVTCYHGFCLDPMMNKYPFAELRPSPSARRIGDRPVGSTRRMAERGSNPRPACWVAERSRRVRSAFLGFWHLHPLRSGSFSVLQCLNSFWTCSRCRLRIRFRIPLRHDLCLINVSLWRILMRDDGQWCVEM